MKDLGFGILDRRTIIVTLILIAIANAFFQFDLPVRIDNTGNFFTDLVVMTGYLYLARSLVRVLIVTIYFLISEPFRSAYEFKQSQKNNEAVKNNTDSRLKAIIYKIVGMLKYSIKSAYFTILIIPFFIFGSSDFEARLIEFENAKNAIIVRYATFFRFIERVSLIAIVAFATMPNYKLVAYRAGVIGLLLMMIIYIFKGDFTFIIKDKIEKDTGNK